MVMTVMAASIGAPSPVQVPMRVPTLAVVVMGCHGEDIPAAQDGDSRKGRTGWLLRLEFSFTNGHHTGR